MLMPCSRAQAIFPAQGVRLDRCAPGFMVWDEHGGTYVVRVDEPAATKVAPDQAATGILLEIPLSPQEALIRSLEEFAAQQLLPLGSPSDPVLAEAAVMAACHLPGANLVIFAEEPDLVAQKRGDCLEITITGSFRARRVPCQETDLVIHLTRAAMARLIALALSLVRAGM